jgi:two-component system chemotaxis sensor kinase CheA
MGMDALTSAAFDSLTKEILPKLAEYLETVALLPSEDRQPDPEMAAILTEANELLGLMSGWFGGVAPRATNAIKNASELPSELSDDDALNLLGSEGVETMSDISLSGKRSVAESLNAGDDDLSDEDAMAMMIESENTPATKATPANKPMPAAKSGADTIKSAPAKAASATEEISDEEAMAMMMADSGDSAPASDELSDADAMAMMAGMDTPAVSSGSEEISDDEAMRLLAEMDAPAAQNNDSMSDEEARRLLAEMDGPAAPNGGEMDDAEARRLLAEMDAPASKSSHGADSMSADDEAMALLLQMGGGDDTPPATEATKAPAARPAAKAAPQAPTHDEHISEDLEEISEFSQNDFSSDPDMMNDFLSNTADLMETLDTTVLQLEQNPKDKETIESIFRAAHTLKGAAGMFGFKAIERVMHRMENLFDLVRKGTLVPDANTIDVVFQGLDILKKLLEAVQKGKPSGTKTVPIVRALELAAAGKYIKSDNAAAKSEPKEAATTHDAGGGGGGGEKPGASAKKTSDQSTIKVDLERLDTLVNLVGELVIDRTRFISIEDEIRQSHPQMPVSGNMSETVQLFGRHMNEIHDLVMKIRMVPIGNTFTKFTRIIRDLSRQLDKEIELYLDGEDTELDKTLVEQIGDPLIHLIRNSCDHGIELPGVREAAGKRRAGKIFLSARQEGNHIIITIEDDGKGINADIIKRKAIEKGLIPEDAVLTQRDIFNLIFEPGFSTAEVVTNVSGRGVGMDVVKKQISKLKGLIEIDSEVGKGTKIAIRLPLTLAIMQSLLVESSGEAFAIPLSTVVESVRISPEEIQKVGETEVIKRHGRVLPLMHLNNVLNLHRKNQESWYSQDSRNLTHGKPTAQVRVQKKTDKLFVVIVGSSDNRYGIVVDHLLSQQEMVIKSLGPIMKNTGCVAGGAVQGNGEVVLVLDIQEVMDEFRNQRRKSA